MDIKLTNIQTGKELAINSQSVVIGRDEQADVQLDDPSLRPYQTMMYKARGDKLTVWDLHDGSGTLLNGTGVLKAELKPGDTLIIGQTAFAVEDSKESPRLLKRYCA
jgi:pSer/pThr/pTyr-binding forkhead associated (FHA) protein